jgi:hypothetical protein
LRHRLLGEQELGLSGETQSIRCRIASKSVSASRRFCPVAIQLHQQDRLSAPITAWPFSPARSYT